MLQIRPYIGGPTIKPRSSNEPYIPMDKPDSLRGVNSDSIAKSRGLCIVNIETAIDTKRS